VNQPYKPKKEVMNEMTDETGGEWFPTDLEAMLEEDEGIIRHYE